MGLDRLKYSLLEVLSRSRKITVTEVLHNRTQSTTAALGRDAWAMVGDGAHDEVGSCWRRSEVFEDDEK